MENQNNDVKTNEKEKSEAMDVDLSSDEAKPALKGARRALFTGTTGTAIEPQMYMAVPLGVPRRVGSIQVLTDLIRIKKHEAEVPSPIGIPQPPFTSTPMTPGDKRGVTFNDSMRESRPEKQAIDEAKFLESFEDGSEEAGTSLPGFSQVKTTDPHGPKFPPQMGPVPEFDPSSDVLAADIRRRDLLTNQSQGWLEQELMANSSVGQRTSEYDERMRHVAAGPSKKAIGASYDRIVSHGAAVTGGISGLIQDAQYIPGTPVSTPRPTPRRSPYTSPQTSWVPTPPDAPDFTPESSHAEQYRSRMHQAGGRSEMYDSEAKIDGKVLLNRGEYGSIAESTPGNPPATWVDAFLPMNPWPPMFVDPVLLCLMESPVMPLESPPLSPVEFSPTSPFDCSLRHPLYITPPSLWKPRPLRRMDISSPDLEYPSLSAP